MSLYDDFEPEPEHYGKEPPHIANPSKFAMQQTSITLRDYFAMRAFQTRLAKYNDWTLDELTNQAYQDADAMLKARK